MSEQEFDAILTHAVTDAMAQLGDAVKRTLYYYLDRRFDIKPENVPRRAEEFDKAIAALLGPGAQHFEVMIARNLSAKIDVKVTLLDNGREIPFANYVKQAADAYVSQSNNATR